MLRFLTTRGFLPFPHKAVMIAFGVIAIVAEIQPKETEVETGIQRKKMGKSITAFNERGKEVKIIIIHNIDSLYPIK